jgi:hypothetical protein
MVSNRDKGKAIQDAVYDALYKAEKYSVWDIKRLQLRTQTKTYDAVYKSVMRLEAKGSLGPIIHWDKLGGNRVMVRK